MSIKVLIGQSQFEWEGERFDKFIRKLKASYITSLYLRNETAYVQINGQHNVEISVHNGELFTVIK